MIKQENIDRMPSPCSVCGYNGCYGWLTTYPPKCPTCYAGKKGRTPELGDVQDFASLEVDRDSAYQRADDMEAQLRSVLKQAQRENAEIVAVLEEWDHELRQQGYFPGSIRAMQHERVLAALVKVRKAWPL